jgi:subtilisin family serine protease
MNDRAMPGLLTLPLWPWLLAFVVHRAAVVALGFDGVYFWEECYRLLAAEALVGGWAIPLHELQADPYSGGSLVFAGLLAAASPLVGLSLLALKGVAIAWAATGMALWLAVAKRVGGRTAAHFLGLLWLAAPPVFVVFDTVGMGFHGNTVALTGLQWLLLFRVLDDPRRSAGRLVVWSAAAGLGVWFSYAAAVPLAVAIPWAVASGGLPAQRWPLAALGFAVGFSPWIAYQAVAGGGLEIVAATFAGRSGGDGFGLARLYDLTTRGVPAALHFRSLEAWGGVGLSRSFFAYPWLAVCALAWTACAIPLAARTSPAGNTRRERLAASPELPLLATFPVFLMVLASSNQEFNDHGVVPWFTFRTLVPALPFLFVAVALAASRAGVALRALLLGVPLVLGAVGSAQLLGDGNQQRPRREAEARATGAEALGHLLVFRHGTDPAIASTIDAIPAELRAAAWRGVGFSYAYLYGSRRSGTPLSSLTAALLAIDDEARGAALEGARLAIGAGLEQVAPLPPSPRREAIAAAIELAASGARPLVERDLACAASPREARRGDPAQE